MYLATPVSAELICRFVECTASSQWAYSVSILPWLLLWWLYMFKVSLSRSSTEEQSYYRARTVL